MHPTLVLVYQLSVFPISHIIGRVSLGCERACGGFADVKALKTGGKRATVFKRSVHEIWLAQFESDGNRLEIF